MTFYYHVLDLLLLEWRYLFCLSCALKIMLCKMYTELGGGIMFSFWKPDTIVEKGGNSFFFF